VDDPADRLLPSKALLQTLRLFANQATAALESSGRFQEMRFLAEHDALTKLLNRRAFSARMEVEIGRATRYRRQFAVVLCDLDGFKSVNDRHGHLTGDDVLSQAAAALQSSVRAADAVFRIGGDEFAVILPETTVEQMAPVLRRLDRAVAEACLEMGVDASFGVAMFPADGEDADSLFRAADAAMYTHKRAQSHDSQAA
jgi:diguanylate cyclase (GGDEF)-like protein